MCVWFQLVDMEDLARGADAFAFRDSCVLSPRSLSFIHSFFHPCFGVMEGGGGHRHRHRTSDLGPNSHFLRPTRLGMSQSRRVAKAWRSLPPLSRNRVPVSYADAFVMYSGHHRLHENTYLPRHSERDAYRARYVCPSFLSSFLLLSFLFPFHPSCFPSTECGGGGECGGGSECEEIVLTGVGLGVGVQVWSSVLSFRIGLCRGTCVFVLFSAFSSPWGVFFCYFRGGRGLEHKSFAPGGICGPSGEREQIYPLLLYRGLCAWWSAGRVDGSMWPRYEYLWAGAGIASTAEYSPPDRLLATALGKIAPRFCSGVFESVCVVCSSSAIV